MILEYSKESLERLRQIETFLKEEQQLPIKKIIEIRQELLAKSDSLIK